MSLGFSLGTRPVQAANALPAMANETVAASANLLLAKTAAVAVQLGNISSFFTIINTNRHFVARHAILTSASRDDETLDEKRTKNIVRKLQTEKTEPSNDQRPDK